MKKFLFTILLAGLCIPAFNQSSGPKYPSTVSGTGTNPWTNASAASTAGGGYASAFIPHTGANYSAPLIATSFGFTIPVNATITGIQVSMKRYANDPGVSDMSVYLTKNGTAAIGANKASYGWATSDETTTYGGSSDLWSLSFTPAEINGGTFGVYIAAANGNFDDDNVAFVDMISVTVYYSTPPGVVISSDGSGPSAGSAIFEVKSSVQGFLLPRMTTVQRTAISGPVEGLMVYDLNIHKPYFYNGSAWNTFAGTANSPGGGGNEISGENQDNLLPQTVAKQDEQIKELIRINNDLLKRIEKLEKAINK